MSVVIRLTKMGKRGEAKYRVVVKEKRSRRDGDAIETLGFLHKRENGIEKKIDIKRLEYWVSKGAVVSKAIKSVI